MIQNELCNLSDDVHSLMSKSVNLFASWQDDNARKFKIQGLDALESAWNSYKSEMESLDEQIEIMRNRIERAVANCQRLSMSV